MSSSQKTAFPVFDEEQLAAVAAVGELTQFEPGAVLIKQGQKDYPFFAIKSGSVRIVEVCDGKEALVVNHGPGEFTGDVDMLTGRSAVISAIANEAVVAYRLCAGRLRKLLNECPVVSDVLLAAFQVRRKLLEESNFIGVKVIGQSGTLETMRLREFLYKNHVPHRFYESTDDSGAGQLRELSTHGTVMPVVHCNGHTLSNPSLPKLAECIGISRDIQGELFDLVIVGAGPAGLAAAVYATSEGIRTLVIDSVGPGGQAGSSSKIENFIGFPAGISGGDLANRGYLQALKFGAQFIAPITVKSIEKLSEGDFHLHLCTGQTARARCVLVAAGVTYRQLGVKDGHRFEGAGLYYAATSVEARTCEQGTAVIVGGGNSAGQAAMFLANSAQSIKVVIRGDDLSKSMSAYLCQRVLNHPRIEVITNSEISEIHGERRVEAVTVVDHKQNVSTRISTGALFCFIGAQPRTEWLPRDVLLDDKGYICTGAAIPASHRAQHWKLDRSPCDLETTVPGILAAGDARSGSTKRCGFAVGDGSMAVTCVHRYLASVT